MEEFEIKDIELAEAGERVLDVTALDMPILKLIALRFKAGKIFKGLNISMCLHMTPETAMLALALKDGGANVYMAASNSSSVHDDVMAALAVNHGIHVYAKNGETKEEYLANMDKILSVKPHIVIDDGGTILPRLYENYEEYGSNLIGTTEQTSSGINKANALEQSGKLSNPLIAVNTSKSKHMFDNKFGVGQTYIEGLLKSTNSIIAGRVVVVCGYGFVGKGIASRAKGMGASVIITEVDPYLAMDAYLEGYRVMTMDEASFIGDIFVTATGNTKIISYENMKNMKDGAIVSNCGSGVTEVDVAALKKNAIKHKHIKEYLDAYYLSSGKKIIVIADGKVVNLVCANGVPSEIMDMSFSVQCFALEHLVKNKGKLHNKVMPIPEELDRKIIMLKLCSYGVSIDKQTKEQQDYYINSMVKEK